MYRLTAFFVQDVSLDITDTIKVTLRQLYNPEQMKRINIYTFSCLAVFSCVEVSKSCFICKHKNTGLVTVSAKPRTTIFCSIVIFVPMGVVFCKQHLFNCLNSHIFKHYNLHVVSLIRICPYCFCSLICWRDISINKSKSYNNCYCIY